MAAKVKAAKAKMKAGRRDQSLHREEGGDDDDGEDRMAASTHSDHVDEDAYDEARKRSIEEGGQGTVDENGEATNLRTPARVGTHVHARARGHLCHPSSCPLLTSSPRTCRTGDMMDDMGHSWGVHEASKLCKDWCEELQRLDTGQREGEITGSIWAAGSHCFDDECAGCDFCEGAYKAARKAKAASTQGSAAARQTQMWCAAPPPPAPSSSPPLPTLSYPTRLLCSPSLPRRWPWESSEDGEKQEEEQADAGGDAEGTSGKQDGEGDLSKYDRVDTEGYYNMETKAVGESAADNVSSQPSGTVPVSYSCPYPRSASSAASVASASSCSDVRPPFRQSGRR